MRELLSALDFVLFMLALGGLCGIIVKMPWYRRMNARLFPETEVNENDNHA